MESWNIISAERFEPSYDYDTTFWEVYEFISRESLEIHFDHHLKKEKNDERLGTLL